MTETSSHIETCNKNSKPSGTGLDYDLRLIYNAPIFRRITNHVDIWHIYWARINDVSKIKPDGHLKGPTEIPCKRTAWLYWSQKSVWFLFVCKLVDWLNFAPSQGKIHFLHAADATALCVTHQCVSSNPSHYIGQWWIFCLKSPNCVFRARRLETNV